jgi:hypothetical protein
MARAGTLIGISYRLAVYQQTGSGSATTLRKQSVIEQQEARVQVVSKKLIRAAVPIPGPGIKSWRKHDPLSRVESKY